MRKATVMRNSIPVAIAAFFSRFLLISMFVFPWYGEMSSEVMSRIMDVNASHRLMSQKDRGMFTGYPSTITGYSPQSYIECLFLLKKEDNLLN